LDRLFELVPVAVRRGFPPGTPVVAAIDQVVASLDLDGLGHRRLGSLIVGLDRLAEEAVPNPVPVELPSLARSRLIHHGVVTWEAFASTSVGEMMAWTGMGAARVRHVMAFLIEAVLRNDSAGGGSGLSFGAWGAAPGNDPALTESAVLEALRAVSAWGATRGVGSVLGSLSLAMQHASADRPGEALDFLGRLDAAGFAGDLSAVFDASEASERLVAEFDGRDRQILLERVLGGSAALTLEELGGRFGVTRERVRQLEERVLKKLTSLLQTDAYSAIRARAEAIRMEAGVAAPLALAPRDLDPDGGSVGDRLLAYLAGPYRSEDGWLVRQDVKDLSAFVEQAVLEVLDYNGCAPTDVAVVELLDQGFTEEAAEVALAGHPRFRIEGEFILRWVGSMAEKALVVLRLKANPMAGDDLFSLVAEGQTLGSLRNALGTDVRFRRSGRDIWSLTEWGHEEYQGIVPAMVDRLAAEVDGSLPVAELAEELSERFGISPNSVSIHANRHPAFVASSGFVRLRRDDEPYLPNTDLRQHGACVMIDGSWALSLSVDFDLLRGSGRSIPEPFAVHVRVQPGRSGRLNSPVGLVHFSWGQRPTIGSLRAAASSLGLAEGDRLFVRRATPSSLDFVGIAADEVSQAEPLQRLALLLGRRSGASDWVECVADALDIGPGESREESDLLKLVRARGDARVLEAVVELASGAGDPQ
jgi:DNA-binding CsgD family transcriptional regulator